MEPVKFEDYISDNIILENLSRLNYTEITFIQSQLLIATKKDQDLLIISPTGTGKTEAYVLPILNKLLAKKAPSDTNVLIITPTRELVLQTAKRIKNLIQGSEIKAIAIYGGQSYDNSKEELADNPSIIIASPGRLLDLLDKQWLSLADIEIVVIDEVDELLAMGFIQSLQLILGKLNSSCLKWMVSATMNQETRKLAKKILANPTEIISSSNENKIEEYVYFVDKQNKKELIHYLITINNFDQVIVFTRTTHAVDRIVKYLIDNGIASASLYGDKKQSEREEALLKLINKQIQVLVATDIATRGIDIPSLQAIINYEVPDDQETYIHRIGRSARGQSSGIAITFCDHEDNFKLIDLQSNLRKNIPVNENHPFMENWQKGLLNSSKMAKKKRK